MWVPDHFSSLESAWPAEVIDLHPFALLVTTADGVPVATHIPVLIEPEDRERAETGLEGVRILGHLARENSQWQETDEDGEALVVIGGPNAYISPSLYEDSQPAAPTWNYVSVHVHGPIRWIHEPSDMMRIIDLTIDRTEGNEGTAWDREPSRPYFERILRGIVGFEIVVTRFESTFKVSQDQPKYRTRDVAEAGQHGQSPELIEWTHRANPDVFNE